MSPKSVPTVLLVEDSADDVDFHRYQQLLAQIVEYWLEAVVPGGGHAKSTIDQIA